MDRMLVCRSTRWDKGIHQKKWGIRREYRINQG